MSSRVSALVLDYLHRIPRSMWMAVIVSAAFTVAVATHRQASMPDFLLWMFLGLFAACAAVAAVSGLAENPSGTAMDLNVTRRWILLLPMPRWQVSTILLVTAGVTASALMGIVLLALLPIRGPRDLSPGWLGFAALMVVWLCGILAWLPENMFLRSLIAVMAFTAAMGMAVGVPAQFSGTPSFLGPLGANFAVVFVAGAVQAMSGLTRNFEGRAAAPRTTGVERVSGWMELIAPGCGRTEFRSPGEAQRWLEWRTGGLAMPVATLSITIPLAAILHSTGERAIAIMPMIWMPMLGFGAGAVWGSAGRTRSSGPGTFYQTRPLTSAGLANALQRQIWRSAFIAGLIAAVPTIFIPFGMLGAVPRAAYVLGAIFLTWTFAGIGFALTRAPRPWATGYTLFFFMVAYLSGFLSTGQGLIPSTQAILRIVCFVALALSACFLVILWAQAAIARIVGLVWAFAAGACLVAAIGWLAALVAHPIIASEASFKFHALGILLLFTSVLAVAPRMAIHAARHR